MPNTYPLPSHAANIWLAGDKILVGFPPLPGNERGHTIQLDQDERGLNILLSLLRERAREAAPQTIGYDAVPTQHQINQALAKFKGKISRIEPKQDLPEDATLEDLGL